MNDSEADRHALAQLEEGASWIDAIERLQERYGLSPRDAEAIVERAEDTMLARKASAR